MDHATSDHTRTDSRHRRMPDPLREVVATALDESGSARDRVEIISAEEVKGFGASSGESRLRRLLVRLQLSWGDDLDDSGQTRHQPVSGQATIQVRSRGTEEQVRVHAILSQDGGDPTHYFGRWTIAPSDRR